MTAELRRPLRGLPTITQVWGPTAFEGEPAAFGHAHFHLGVDYGVQLLTPVYSPADAAVRYVGWDDNGFGLVVWLDHINGLSSVVAHLKEALVCPGSRIGQHAPVALSGTTGNSTGPHLHFGVQRRGVWIPPASVMNLAPW